MRQKYKVGEHVPYAVNTTSSCGSVNFRGFLYGRVINHEDGYVVLITGDNRTKLFSETKIGKLIGKVKEYEKDGIVPSLTFLHTMSISS